MKKTILSVLGAAAVLFAVMHPFYAMGEVAAEPPAREAAGTATASDYHAEQAGDTAGQTATGSNYVPPEDETTAGGSQTTENPEEKVYQIDIADEDGQMIDTFSLPESSLDAYGGFYLSIAMDRVHVPAGKAFGGWYDEAGSLLYSYTYDGAYFVNIYPSADMTVSVRYAAEDYFIEDTVLVFTNEKVSVGEEE